MSDKLNYAVMIPARYASSRFPGKPLVDILGKPMIQHVWERCCEAVGREQVYVATDDAKIADVVTQFGGQVIMTSDNCLTGTDRLAEANASYDFDFVVNVQGDEPLINPEDITKVVEAFVKHGDITNAMCKITSSDEFNSVNVPKVVCSKSGRLLYMSRSAVPGSKSGDFEFGYKQVCIYAFSRDHLNFFRGTAEKSPLERVEDIEILRFIEADYNIRMVEVDHGSIAVDIPSDVERVLNALSESNS